MELVEEVMHNTENCNASIQCQEKVVRTDISALFIFFFFLDFMRALFHFLMMLSCRETPLDSCHLSLSYGYRRVKYH